MKKLVLTFSFLIIGIVFATAQSPSQQKFGKGIKIIGQDSSYMMKFSMRFQNLMTVTIPENEDAEVNFLVRRARLKFSGFAYNPKLQYKVELGLSNRDHGSPIPQTKNSSRVILDAVLKYKFAKNTSLWIGQTKLPGNRERVISSQKLQLVDRSLLNSYYNIDRDIGFQLRHHWKLGGMVIKEALSVSQGEGRNITSGNEGGFDYTGRLEFLPFGEFTSKGDYFGSDLKREKKPKLAIGISYDYHDDAMRERGNTKDFLSDTRTLSTIFADMMFKYKGFSFMAEYANKVADGSPVVLTDSLGTVLENFYTGTGLNFTGGYLFAKNWEIAGRYTLIQPNDEIEREDITMYTLGFSRYIVGHNLKIQTDMSLIEEGSENTLMYRLQFELAF